MDIDYITTLLALIGFEKEEEAYVKYYNEFDKSLTINVSANGYISYKEFGIAVGRATTSNLLDPENLVVLHCVDKLLCKGYKPEHIELEPAWRLGHSAKGGYADIWVRTYKDDVLLGGERDKDSLLIIECKTYGKEFDAAWSDTKEDGAQLFSYFQQESETKFLCLFTSRVSNGLLEHDYRLINVQDNEEMLAQDPSQACYRDATNNKQKYNVWKTTYCCDYATRGLFEDDIAAYNIGKNKYSVSDLNCVDNDSIQKKYNEFALILRQHNVGSHENAFDKLVNLFLAKVVDETNNSDNLHFYWKGAAYDDAFQLQDRLQRLYRDGMKKFLNEDVTYIENNEIENAFRRFKSDPDSTKKTILEYFRALKFFSDNDFSFISVHNKKLFEQNAAILLKVVKMLQDIKLKGSDQNQLLGDLFEGFLNKGVKQSEGQYFTPMPIVRFLVSSLPIESLVQSRVIPMAIDYACGAGHFLSEYAFQIKDFAKKHHPSIPLNAYYSHITGIEKEYRLSKVSKVSAFMYGHDETNIIYADALTHHEQIKEGGYDVLIANPPYSVKGFLETLPERDRMTYTLFDESLNIERNNAIETFFIERAAQLLNSGGVAGIILPVSVLNKGQIYSRTREIIFQNFDIVALVGLGSGTFGKTGTNTVTLFLRRKERNTPDAEHYQNRVNCWFKTEDSGNSIYQDSHIIEEYCAHCGYRITDYLEFLSGKLTDTFLETEQLKEYRKTFTGVQRNSLKGVCLRAKTICLDYRAETKKKYFRALSDEEKKQKEELAFRNFTVEIEKDKLYYYSLVSANATPVVVVQSPAKTAENKKFLGYEWSDGKGNEGIKYLNVETKQSVEDDNEDDDDTMLQIRGINSIMTPLFNPADLYDAEKINTIIRKNFVGDEFSIPEKITQYVSAFRLVDMIDFKSSSFTKEIRTSVSKTLSISSIYDSVPLASFCSEINPSKADLGELPRTMNVSFLDMPSVGQGTILKREVKKVDALIGGGYTTFRENDVLIAKISPCMENGKCALAESLTNGIGFGSTEFHVFRTTSRNRSKFLLEYLNCEHIRKIAASNMTGASGHRRVPEHFYSQLPIPNVPDNVLNRIVSKCAQIDNVCNRARIRINELSNQRSQIFYQAQLNARTDLRMNRADVFDVSIGRRVKLEECIHDGIYDVFSANVFTPFGKTKTSVLSDFSLPSVLWGIDGDWMVNYVESGRLFNPTDHCGVIRVLDEEVVMPKYLVYVLYQVGESERFSRANRASTERIKSLTISVPDIQIQREVVEKVNSIECEISNLMKLLEKEGNARLSILTRYLGREGKLFS